MTTRKYSSRSQQTTLTAALTASATTATVVSGAGLLGGVTISAGETFTIVIDPDTALEEIVDVTATSTNTLTIVRGIDGSTGQAHSAGAVVRHMMNGRDLREANQHIENTTTAHGITLANLVKTTDTGTVSNAMLAANAVTTAKITDANVTTAKIADSAVTTAKVADSNVTTAKIADLNVTTGKIADSAVTSAKIADGTIVAGDIADGAITSAKILDGTIVTGDLADSAVTSAKIADGAIVNADVNTSAQIAYSKLNLTNTIVNADINASAAIDKTKISGTAITAADTGTVTSAIIADGTIVNGDINASAAIALSKLATDPLARSNHTGTQAASTISDFDTQVRTSKVTDLTAPTGSFSMNSQKITNLATPTSSTDAATKAYADLMVPLTQVGANSGIATLDSTGKLTTSQIPDVTITDTFVVSSQSAMLALTAQIGDVAVRTDLNKSFILRVAGASTLANWQELLTPTDSVLSVDGQTGAVSLSSTYATVANAANKLPLAGGTMSGAIAMGANKITGLGTPTSTGDAATKDYADTKLPLAGGTMSGAIAMGTNKVTGVGDPTSAQDAATKNYVDTTVIAPSNLTGPITSVGNATSIASKTGTGTKFVVDTSPTLVTPELGVATATSINGTTIPSSKTLVATDSTQYVVPSQAGNSGKYLKTDGTTSSWSSVDALPSQTGNAGKLLGTNGTAVAWTSNLVNPNVQNGLKAKIAITSSNYIRDYDGNSVSDSRGGTPYPMVGIQNAGNVWIGAAYTNSGNTYVYSSTDGITWSFLDFIGAFGFTHDSNCKVAYNGSVFVVSGGSGDLGITTNITDYARVATPPTFTDSSQAYRATISSFNGYFFLPDFAGSNMFYSSDGNTWSSSSLPTTANWSSTAYGAGKYVVVANDSATAAYATSPSGTWTSITMPSTGYQSITYDGSKFIAIGNATLATSTDGVTWTARTFTETGEWSIAYSAGGYIATAVNTALTYVLTSTDGITWSQYDLSASTSSVKFKIGYIKSQPNSGILNIIGDSGTNGQVVVSTGAGVKWGSPGAATPTVSGTVYGQTTDANSGYDYNVTGVGYNVFNNSIFSPVNAQRNTGVGSSVLKNLTYGISNNVVGSYETSITTGSYNTLMGDLAGPSITTAYYNTAVGTEALRDTTTSNYNVALGSFAGATNITGSGVTAVGYKAGLYNKQNNNTFLGLEAGNISGQYDGYTNTNVTAIGYSAAPSSKTVNDEITLGNSSISTIRANVTSITSLSDERDKTAIEPLTVGLDFVNELKPVQFEWNMRDGGKVGQLDAGFIAQDLVAAEDATGLADYLQLTMRENPEKLEATQGRLIPILVKAIQELSAEVKALKEGK